MNPERKYKARRVTGRRLHSTEETRKRINYWIEDDPEDPLFNEDEVVTLLGLTAPEMEKFRREKMRDLLNDEPLKVREPTIRMMTFINAVRERLSTYPQGIVANYDVNSLTTPDLITTTNFTLAEMEKMQISNAWDFFIKLRDVNKLLPKL